MWIYKRELSHRITLDLFLFQLYDAKKEEEEAIRQLICGPVPGPFIPLNEFS